MDFELELEERLERALGYPSEVRVLNRAPRSFRYQVVRGGRPLAVRHEDARVAFQARVWSAYADFAPFRRRDLHEVLGHGPEPRNWDVDDREVYRLLKERLGDVECFRVEFARAAGLSVAPPQENLAVFLGTD